MHLTPRDWHKRYLTQAGWTAQIRSHIYTQLKIRLATRILEVGCGTGALLYELPTVTSAEIFGLDLDRSNLELSAQNCPRARLVQADAHALPYPDGKFDIVLCHFLLLWVRNPVQVVSELRRVTHPGGAVLALAEPDYAARLDYPTELAQLGALQRQALLEQGAQPDIGRRLGEIFIRAGLEVVETGVVGGQWRPFLSPNENGVQQSIALKAWEEEWQILANDLGDRIPPSEFQRLREIDRAAWKTGERVLFIPTFYAWGIR